MDYRSLLWKLYFFLIIILLVASYYLNNKLGLLNYSHYIDIAISGISLIALYGIAFNKRLFTAKFWQVYFFILVFWDISFNVVIDAYIRNTTFDPVSLFGLVLLLPIYFAVFIYGFRYLKP